MGKQGKSKDKLTMKEQLLVHAITDVGKPTFGNGTQSALKAYDTEDENTAANIASIKQRNPKIQGAIAEAMKLHGIDDNVQIGSIKRILAGAREYDTVVTHYGKGNKPTGRTVTTVKVSNKDILQANALLYKVTGRFDANRAIGKAMSDKLRAIAREFRPPKSQGHVIPKTNLGARSEDADTGSSTGRGGGGPRRARGGEDAPSRNSTQIPKGGVEVPSEASETPLKPVKSKPAVRKRGVKAESKPKTARKTANSRKKVPKGGTWDISDGKLSTEEIADLMVKLKEIKPKP